MSKHGNPTLKKAHCVGDQNQGNPVLGSIPIASRSSLLGFGLGALFEGLLIKDMLTVTLLVSIWCVRLAATGGGVGLLLS